MSLNDNNLYNVQSKTGQPVIIVDGVAFPVGPVYNVEESTTDLSFITATANDILQGKIGVDVNGNQIEGNIETVTATLNNNIITVPKGYIETAQTLTVNVAQEPAVDGNVVTFFPGYVENEESITIGNAKEAQTYTPNTVDQTIAADTFLTGVQTIKGDANLLAENIKEGISIFGITGTHKGGSESSTDYYKCAVVHEAQSVTRITVANAGTAAVNGEYEKTTLTTESGGEVWKHISAEYYVYDFYDLWGLYSDYGCFPEGALYYCGDGVTDSWSVGNGSGDAPTVTQTEVTTGSATWDGYKAVLTDDSYSFEETLTEGLVYSSVTPEVDKIYADGALVEVKKLYGIASGEEGEDTSVTITVSTESYDVEWSQYSSITSIQLAASASDGGTPLFVATNLPSGISVSTAGLISGTPSEVKEGSFKVYVAYPGAVGKEITINYNTLLQWGSIELYAENLNLEVGKAFSQQYSPYVSNGGEITSYEAEGLPDGLTLSDTGLLSGTPTTEVSSGSFKLTITAYRCNDFSTNIRYTVCAANDNSFETPYNWSDIASGTAVTDFDKTELKSNKKKVYVKVPLSAGVEYTFWCISDAAGNFDEYLWLYDMDNNALASNDDTDGGSRFTYTPETTGYYMLVLGSYSDDGIGKFNEIIVTPAPSLESAVTPEITVTTPVTLTGTQNSAITDIQLVATVSDNGTPTFTSSDLPAGLTLSNTGLISGTPTGSGEGTSTITVSYTGSESKTITLNWTIEAAVSEKTYVYTVSGAGTTAVNGDYYDTGETYSGQSVYTNGNYYLYFLGDYGSSGHWVLDDAIDAPPFTYHCTDLNVLPNEGSWLVDFGASPVPTITKYSGEGDDSGGSEYILRASGFPDASLNGDYVSKIDCYVPDCTEHWVKQGQENVENPISLFHWSGNWYIGVANKLDHVTHTLPYNRLAGDDVTVQNWYHDDDLCYMTDAKVEKVYLNSGDSSSSDSSGSDDTYIVSGAGQSDANGTYTRSGDIAGYPLYVKGNWQLYYQNDVIRTCTVIANPALYPAYVYSMQSGSDGNYAGGTWEANGSSFAPAPTVVKGGGDSGDDGDSSSSDSSNSGSTDNINGELTESGSYLASNFENDAFNGTYTYAFTDSSGKIYFTNGKSGIMGPSQLLRENDRFILKYEVSGGAEYTQSATSLSPVSDSWLQTSNGNVASAGSLVVNSSGDSNDDKTYVYTVSGAGTAAVNGDYWDTGDTYNGYPVYTNGSYHLKYALGTWSFVAVNDQYDSQLYLCGSNMSPEEGGWIADYGDSPVPTVTAYAGEGGGDSGSGDSGDVQAACYEVTNSGIDGCDGLYYDLGDVVNGKTQYENLTSGAHIKYDSSNSKWVLTNPVGEVELMGDNITDISCVSVAPEGLYACVNCGVGAVTGSYRLVTAEEKAAGKIGSYAFNFPANNEYAKYVFWTNESCVVYLGQDFTFYCDGDYWACINLETNSLLYELMGAGVWRGDLTNVDWSIYEGASPTPTFVRITT